LTSRCSELCDIDLRHIINYEIWNKHLTAEERNSLQLLFPSVDRRDEETLIQSFKSNMALHTTLREYQDLQKCATFEASCPRLAKWQPMQRAQDDIDVEPYMSFRAKPPQLTEENLAKLSIIYSRRGASSNVATNSTATRQHSGIRPQATTKQQKEEKARS